MQRSEEDSSTHLEARFSEVPLLYTMNPKAKFHSYILLASYYKPPWLLFFSFCHFWVTKNCLSNVYSFSTSNLVRTRHFSPFLKKDYANDLQDNALLSQLSPSPFLETLVHLFLPAWTLSWERSKSGTEHGLSTEPSWAHEPGLTKHRLSSVKQLF